MNSSIYAVGILSTCVVRKITSISLDTHCLGVKQGWGRTSTEPCSWHTQRKQTIGSTCRMHCWRVKTHTAHLFFVSEQKATGKQLLVARKMSGLHSKLTLTFYKGVKTNMNDQFYNTVTRSVSSKALVPAQESENFSWHPWLSIGLGTSDVHILTQTLSAHFTPRSQSS